MKTDPVKPKTDGYDPNFSGVKEHAKEEVAAIEKDTYVKGGTKKKPCLDFKQFKRFDEKPQKNLKNIK